MLRGRGAVGCRAGPLWGPECAAAGSPLAPDSPLPPVDDHDEDYEGASHGGAAKPAGALSTAAWSGTNGHLAEGEAAGARRGSWSRPPRSLRRRATVSVGPSESGWPQRPRTLSFSKRTLAPGCRAAPQRGLHPGLALSTQGPGSPQLGPSPPPVPSAPDLSPPPGAPGAWSTFFLHQGSCRRHTLVPCTYLGAISSSAVPRFLPAPASLRLCADPKRSSSDLGAGSCPPRPPFA